MRLGSSSSRWCSTSVGDFGLGRFAGSGRQRCLVATVAGCDKFGDLPAPLSPHSTHCSWIRWHQVPPYRWAGSVSQTMADSVQAAVLGSMVVPSKLCSTLIQPLGRRRQHARAYDEFWQICSAVTSTRNYSLLLITTQQGISLFTSRPSQAEALSRDNNFSTLISGLALTIKRSCPGCGWMRSSRPGEVTAAQ